MAGNQLLTTYHFLLTLFYSSLFKSLCYICNIKITAQTSRVCSRNLMKSFKLTLCQLLAKLVA